MSIDKLQQALKARGNWGHGGRPGKVGGSTPGKGGGMDGVTVNSKVSKIIMGLPAGSRVGQLEVGAWDATAGYRNKVKNYKIVTMHGNLATGASKEALLRVAQEHELDLSDKTYGK